MTSKQPPRKPKKLRDPDFIMAGTPCFVVASVDEALEILRLGDEGPINEPSR